MAIGNRTNLGRAGGLGLLVLFLAGCVNDPSTESDTMHGYSKPSVNRSYDDGIARFTSLHETDPSDLNALMGLAKHLRYAGRADEAVALLEDNEKTFADNIAFVIELGKANLAAGKVSTAKSILERSLQYDHKNWQAYSALGITHDLMRRRTEAADAYAHALQLCPDSASILNNMGLSVGLSGDVDRAIGLLSKASTIQPRSQRIQNNLLVFRNIQIACVDCDMSAYGELASTIYGQDWTLGQGDLRCGQDFASAEQIVSTLTEKTFIDMKVHFEFDSAVLRADAKEALDELAMAITSEELRAFSFVLEGHTDAVGTDEYNQDLSERRAASVKDYLSKIRAIPSERLDTIGYGESRLADPAHPKSGENRRVRIKRVDPLS